MKKYTLILSDLIKDKTTLNGSLIYYLGCFLKKEYFLAKDAIYITTYNYHNWNIEDNCNSVKLSDLYAVKLLKEYPKNPDDIELKTILKNEKYNYCKNDFLTWIDEPSEIIKEVDLPYYKIIKILLDKKVPNRKSPLAKLIKQTSFPKHFLYEWSCHRIFCDSEFSNIWVYDFPSDSDEPYFFLTDSKYIQNTTKVAILNFKTPTYHKPDYDKGIYKRENVKRKFWYLDKDYIEELIEFLKSPSNRNKEHSKGRIYDGYKKYVKTNWQKLIFEYNHNSAGWGWGDRDFNIPPEKDKEAILETIPFDTLIPDYTKLLDEK